MADKVSPDCTTSSARKEHVRIQHSMIEICHTISGE